MRPVPTVVENKTGRTMKVGRARQSFVPAGDDPRTGGAWDVQALAALFVPCYRSALFVGVGGATVPRILRWMHPNDRPEFHGVDHMDVIQVAQDEGFLDGLGFKSLYEHGARMFINEPHPHRRYEIVFEDMFEEYRKPITMRKDIYIELTKLAEWVYVGNVPSAAIKWYRPLVRRAFPYVVQVQHEELDNIILYGSRGALDARECRDLVELDGRFDTLLRKLSFRTIQHGRSV